MFEIFVNFSRLINEFSSSPATIQKKKSWAKMMSKTQSTSSGNPRHNKTAKQLVITRKCLPQNKKIVHPA
jgi:hypothetical protein